MQRCSMGKALEIPFTKCEVNGTAANQQTAWIDSPRPYAAGGISISGARPRGGPRRTPYRELAIEGAGCGSVRPELAPQLLGYDCGYEFVDQSTQPDELLES